MSTALGIAPIYGPKNGIYIRHSHYYADQHCIGHIQNRQPDKAQHSDDRGIDNLTDDEPAEYLIALYRQVQDHICAGRLKNCVRQLFALPGNFSLLNST